MPITQARVLSLLGAGQDYQRGLEKLISLIHGMQAKTDNGRIEPGSALATITAQASTLALLQQPVESPLVIRLEAIHFAKEGRRNVQKTAKARENRMYAAEGLPHPNRGDGRIISQTSAKQINPIIRAQSGATAPAADFVGIVKLAPDGQFAPGAHGQAYLPEITSNARELEALSEPDFSGDNLDLGVEEPPAPPRFPIRAGYSMPESLCKHEMVVDGKCLECGADK